MTTAKPDATAPPAIIYIAGFGRSGSTLLSIVLGAHPEALSVGEINQLFVNWGQPKKRCACGERLRNCPMWSQVREAFESALPHITLEQAAAVTQQVERLGARPHAELLRTYQTVWRTVMTSVARVSGTRYLIDSSKTAVSSFRRPDALRQAGFDVRVVHLVRDPRAVVWSTIRLHRARTGRTGWLDTNARGIKTLLHLILTETRQNSLVRVNYELLTTQPQAVLKVISTSVDVDFSPVCAQIDRNEPLIAEHVLDGDMGRMNSGGSGLHLRPARADWRGQLPMLLSGCVGLYMRLMQHPVLQQSSKE